MGDAYARNLTGVDALKPGEYTVAGVTEFVDAKCVLRCKSCGGIDVIADAHEVSPGGRVVPAWHCPTATCGLVEWLHLESWAP